MGSFPGSPINNTIRYGNGFHCEKSPSPLWGEIISHDNELDLPSRVSEQLLNSCISLAEGKGSGTI